MIEKETKTRIYVVGHKNPDTDSICSALSYAYLKNQLATRWIRLCCRKRENILSARAPAR